MKMKILLLLNCTLLVGAIGIHLSSAFGQDGEGKDESNLVDELKRATSESVPESKQEEAPKVLPNIRKVSKSPLRATQGDKIKLSIQATGAELRYRWVRNYRTICTTADCEFDSQSWGVGPQNITVVIYNQAGSRTANFQITLDAPVAGRKVSVIEPALVAWQQKGEKIDTNYKIKSLVGLGYSFVTRADVNVIAQIPRELRWNENVMSHAKGVVQIIHKQVDEQILLPGSAVKLDLHETGRRVIQLRRGSIRVRQLQRAEPEWSVTVKDWIQMDGDHTSDAIIQLVEDKVIVSVVRGYMRVILSDKGTATSRTVLEPGKTYHFENATTKGEEVDIDSKIFSEMFISSSPQYVLRRKTDPGRISSFIRTDIKESKKAPLLTALEAANKYLADGDMLLVLESLLPIYGQNSTNYNANLLLGHAYANLGLLPTANRFYKIAASVDRFSAEPAYQMALLNMRNAEWDAAIENFSQALAKGHIDLENIYYQKMVAEYNSGRMWAAKNSLAALQWELRTKEIEQSAKAYEAAIVDQRWYGADGRIGLGFDSNVFRTMGKSEISDVDKTSSFYSLLEGDVHADVYQRDDGGMRFGFAAKRLDYFAKSAKDAAQLQQKIYMQSSLTLGQKSESAKIGRVKIDFEPYLMLLTITEERAADVYGAHFKFTLLDINLSPALYFNYKSLIDPLPARDDGVDPIRFEPVVPSDRTAKIYEYGLEGQLLREKHHSIMLDLGLTNVAYTNKLVNTADYREIRLGLSGKKEFNYSIFADYELSVFDTSFVKALDDRRDSRIDAMTLVGYQWNAAMGFYARLYHLDQRSTRNVSTYNKSDISVGFSLSL